jgi:hypothetical protein
MNLFGYPTFVFSLYDCLLWDRMPWLCRFGSKLHVLQQSEPLKGDGD